MTFNTIGRGSTAGDGTGTPARTAATYINDLVNAANNGQLQGFKNFLINGCFQVNQRAFAGGALASTVYGHDRWQGSGSGGNYSVSGDTVTIASGAIQQIIEAPGLAGEQVTISAEDVTGGSLSIIIGAVGGGSGSASGSIPAGSGRQELQLTVPAGVTANMYCYVGGTAVSFKKIQLERGGKATPFEQRPLSLETMLCRRYFRRLNIAQFQSFIVATTVGSDTYRAPFEHNPPMRTSPSFSTGGTFEDASSGIDLTATAFALSVNFSTLQFVAASTLTSAAISVRGEGAGANTIDFSAEF